MNRIMGDIHIEDDGCEGITEKWVIEDEESE